jgi:EAL domain-containing protein (putative c-di-GMP-specific phosphodiesterase class I)
VAALCLLGLAAWHVWRRPGLWVSLSLLLAAVSAGLRSGAETRYDDLWNAGLYAELAAFVVPALGIGLSTSWPFGRQSRQWRTLEADVRQLRRASPLLPGRSVTPDDDEGLPADTDVHELITTARVRVAIQPVVALQAGGVVGHEALSRFGGRVPTDRWFKAASKYGLGGELERLTLHAALQLLPALPAAEFLAVNISPAALGDQQVVRLLDDVDLSRVVVEITEHEAVADYAVTRRSLDRLRRAGARIAVDDTGAGFASLRHVLMLQPDVIKLDTSLTRGIETDKRQQDLVRAVTDFAEQVGADVLAEGIETQGQLEQLTYIGVHLGQGWHLGVPVLT